MTHGNCSFAWTCSILQIVNRSVPALLAGVGSLSLVWSLIAAEPELIAPPIPAQTPPAAASTETPPGLATPEGVLGYAMGLRIGGAIAADLKAQNTRIDPASLARGLSDAIVGAKPLHEKDLLARALAAFEASMREQEKERGRRMEGIAQVNLVKATEFLKINAAKKGIVSLPSGLQYEVLKAGVGAQPKLADTVSTRYRGTHLDGTEFDGTDPAGEPATFPIRGVVPGWQEALPLMKTGSKWRLYVPPDLGYGVEGSPPVIQPNEVLVFEIELLQVNPAH
ncbi:MAG: FKBP-type peptidyl-prolyl cis-trans isomerase [Planctomycetia bacterium]|nr:FKBP-type peptidyl-prolyl cis-trans isomerase [Planctomycetia bacterium]RLT13295.1 MAG: FKBP-type peptidyl-prolyl cis-trans isomerase [Planctomycetota bacterium]